MGYLLRIEQSFKIPLAASPRGETARLENNRCGFPYPWCSAPGEEYELVRRAITYPHPGKGHFARLDESPRPTISVHSHKRGDHVGESISFAFTFLCSLCRRKREQRIFRSRRRIADRHTTPCRNFGESESPGSGRISLRWSRFRPGNAQAFFHARGNPRPVACIHQSHPVGSGCSHRVSGQDMAARLERRELLKGAAIHGVASALPAAVARSKLRTT
jgi:hypothetical protein